MIVSKSKKSRKKAHDKQTKSSSLFHVPIFPLKTPLDILAEKHIGGSTSTEGFNFQFYYAVYKILSHFTSNNLSQEEFIRLEGVEDIDVISTSAELIQVKFSKNDFDAGKFWAAGVLQNFAEEYIAENQSRFRLVHP
jgi:hypothetical protein